MKQGEFGETTVLSHFPANTVFAPAVLQRETDGLVYKKSRACAVSRWQTANGLAVIMTTKMPSSDRTIVGEYAHHEIEFKKRM